MFHDRVEAGRKLADALIGFADAEAIVLALPRGGVPVAFEIAQKLQAPLDVLVVRKLGTPGQRELAMGAIASGGIRVLNDGVISALGVEPDSIEAVAAVEQQELERREHAYRGDRPYPDVKGRCIILVDDGIATGATIRAAIGALRQQHAARIVIAVPVAPPDTVAALEQEADEVVCLETPSYFAAIGQFYVTFKQVSDGEVRDLLEQTTRTGA